MDNDRISPSDTQEFPSETPSSEPSSTDVSDNEPRWGIPPTTLVLVIIATAMVGVMTSVAGQLVGYAIAGDAEALAVNVCGSIGLWIGILFFPYLIARKRSARLLDLCRLHFKKTDVPLGIAAGLGLQLLVVPLVFYPIRLLAPDRYKSLSDPAKDIILGYAGWELAVLVLVIGIGAPLVEELVFRGFVQGAMAERFSMVAAVITSALIFAVSHAQPLQFIGLFAVGITLGIFRAKFNRIGPCVITHAVFNMTAIALLQVASYQ